VTPPRLIIATSNAHKLREIRTLLPGASLIALGDLPRVEEPEETGDTFEENAALKALSYDRLLQPHLEYRGVTPGLVVAEDSGLVIDALGGEPGVRSARFVGANATYPERFEEIYRRLRDVADGARSARFVCALAVVAAGQVVFTTTGTIEGEIADAPHGDGGFGYDPIFYYPPYGLTLAEVPQPDKLAVAHRGQAFRALAQWLGDRDW
jgi:XTP/dITP diphosphohydrolase